MRLNGAANLRTFYEVLVYIADRLAEI